MHQPQPPLRSLHPDRTPPRILLYSHDTFGLGHLRRSRTIAQALVSAFPDASALILTGSPSGVGMSMDPRRFLQPGDVVRIEIEGLGAIEHAIAAPR